MVAYASAIPPDLKAGLVQLPVQLHMMGFEAIQDVWNFDLSRKI
jgi:hypothetical protein